MSISKFSYFINMFIYKTTTLMPYPTQVTTLHVLKLWKSTLNFYMSEL